MAVDRGGLQYTIRIEDKFSGPLGKFTAEIRAAQRALASLGAGAGALRSTAKAIREVAAASRKAATASKKAKKEETIRERIRRIAAEREKKARLQQAIAQRRAAIATREEVKQARRLATVRQKQVAADKAVTRVVNDRTKAQDRLNAARARGVRLSLEEKRRLGIITDSERTLLRLQKQRAALDAFASSARLRNLTAENEAKRRIIAADKEAATQELLRAQGRTRTGAVAPTVEKTTRAERARVAVLKRLRDGLKRTGQEANRVSFTFRRLFGILAAFAAARAIFRAFRQLTTEIVRFNAVIEQAQLGIASLFLAVGDVRDIFGRNVTAAQGLEIAIGEARNQMDLLRRDALKTAGTFENLLDAFQVAVAPGLQAGLNIDEIRKFTVDISRAATAIGLQQNQLAEEIRSILSGTIQARTTRIAVALGITNEDIRNAKEAGVLIEFLNQRFQAFGEAGEVALTQFNALFTNLKGAIQLVLASGGLEFFNSIKDILAELFDLITRQDPITKILSPDPRAVAIVKNFATGLKNAIGIANDLREALTFKDVATAAKGIGSALVSVANILAGIIQGVIRGFNLLVNLANKVAGAIKGISRDVINIKNLREGVALIATFATLSIGLTAVSGILTALWASIVVSIGLINVGLTAAKVSLKVIRGIMFGIAAIAAFIEVPVIVVIGVIVGIIALLAAGLLLLKDWFESVTGTKISFINFLRLFGRFAIERIKLFVSQTKSAFKGMIAFIKTIAFTAVAGIVTIITDQVSKILDVLGRFNKTAKELALTVKGVGAAVSGAAGAAATAAAQDLSDAGDAFIQAKLDFIKAIEEDQAELVEGGADADVLGGVIAKAKKAFDDLFKNVIPDLTGLFGGIDLGLDDAVAKVRTLGEAFDAVNGIVAASRKGLDKQGELLKKLKDDAISVAGALRLGLATIGLSNSALSIRTSIVKTQNKLRKDSLFLDKDEEQTRERLAATELKLSRIKTQASQVRNKLEEEFLRINVSNFKIIADAEKAVFDARQAETNAEIKLLALRKTGSAQEINNAEIAFSLRTREVNLAVVERERVRTGAEIANLISLVAVERQQELIDLIQLEAVLRAQETVDIERLTKITKDRVLLERELQAILAQRLALLARQAAFQAQLDTQRLSIERFRLAAAAAVRFDLNNAETRVRNARAELLTLAALNEIAKEERDRNFSNREAALFKQQAILQQLRVDLLAAPTGTPEREKLEAQFKLQVKEVNALIAARAELRLRNAEATEIERQNVLLLIDALDAEIKAAETPIKFGFIEGLREFITEAQDIFTTFKGIVKSAFETIGDTLGSALTNAIAGVEQNLREVFANLLKDIATQIIQMLIRLAIARAALAAGFGVAKGGEIGAAKGGSIRAPRARGLADGGFSGPIPNMPAPRAGRPRGLDSRDTIPIWASKGEFMLRARAVQMYGADLINAMNSMLINPALLRAVAGIGNNAGAVRQATRGAAHGGEIGRATEQATPQPAPEPQGLTTAIVAGSEDTMQQLLTGGRNSLLDFLRANKDDYLGAERAVG